MKIGKFIVLILALTNSINIFGSCSGPFFTISELLNHDPRNHHIFTCEILETYVRGHSFESIAVVKRKFKGNPKDTIFINSGGGTTAGGEKLFPNSEWLIFSTTKDSLHYWATACDFLSTQIKESNNENCERRINKFYGQVYLDVLEQYKLIEEEIYSGFKKIYGNERLVAEGKFKNGLPHGQWVHYSRYDEFETGIKRSEISYQNGMLHGEYQIYHEDKDQNIIIEKRMYKSDLPELIESYGQYHKIYEYKSDKERIVISTTFDSSGIKLKQISSIELDYNNKKYSRIRYKHGDYFNKSSRDSSNYSPLAEGKYYRGARIGEWKFFNKKGELIETKMYPEKLDETPQFQIYDEQGNIRLNGLYIDKKRMGSWKYFYDNRLEFEEVYNSTGDKISKTHYYSSGGIEFTPYLNNLKHGQKVVFNKDNTLRSIENYEYGRLSGMSIFFNNDGTIRKESRFINSREFTVNRNVKSSYVTNGFLNGHFIQYHYKTGKKTHEGNYWNGYRIGVWIEHGKNGSYTKKYYPTDKEELINQCGHAMAKLTEQFDQDGNLINSWKY